MNKTTKKVYDYFTIHVESGDKKHQLFTTIFRLEN